MDSYMKSEMRRKRERMYGRQLGPGVRVFHDRASHRNWVTSSKQRRIAHDVRQMLKEEKAQNEGPARDFIGDLGHWIELRETDGDGREKFAVYGPDGMLLCMRWGEAAAEAAAIEHSTTGSISL